MDQVKCEVEMKAEVQVNSLRLQHADLEQQIRLEMSHPHYNEGLVSELKKRKLSLKDQIASVS